VLDHSDQAQAVVTTSLIARTHTTAAIAGTEASILFAAPFYHPSSFRLTSPDHSEPSVDWSDPTSLRGFGAGLSR
jgi:hypothetical protein